MQATFQVTHEYLRVVKISKHLQRCMAYNISFMCKKKVNKPKILNIQPLHVLHSACIEALRCAGPSIAIYMPSTLFRLIGAQSKPDVMNADINNVSVDNS